MDTRSDEQFIADYRPIIWLYALYCVWQGWEWWGDPPTRFSADAFIALRSWAAWIGAGPNAWGLPMLVGGLFLVVGLLTKEWKIRWVGYFILMLTFLSVAEAIRQSASLSFNASQTGVRTYMYVGLMPVVLAVVARVKAVDLRNRRGSDT